MVQTSQAMEQFFRIFEANTNTDNVDAAVSQFADVFMAASPQGAQAVRAADFALALPRKKHLFDRLGCRSTELVSLREQHLDARYTLAGTQWKMTFALPGIEPQDILAESVFIIDTGGNEPKIVFYLAHQDLMQILKDRGLLTA
jgi:hypothetical protein